MSINISYRTKTPDLSGIYSYGFAFISSGLDDAVKSMQDILEDMLQLAEYEKAYNLIADEIEKTRHRVNALEYIMIPEMQENIKYIRMKLDFNQGLK